MVIVSIRQVKREIRIVGVDDARFDRTHDKWTRLVGVIYRGGLAMEGCLQVPIQVDGDDVTVQLVQMIKASAHFGQLRVIMTRDTIFAGVNVLDLEELVKLTELPVIAVSDSKPDMTRVKRALQRFSPNNWEAKFRILEKNGPIHQTNAGPRQASIFLQWTGLPKAQAIELVHISATRSRIPEPLRVAHLIATSFVPNPIDHQ